MRSSQRIQLSFQLARQPDIVGIEKCDILTARLAQSRIAHNRRAARVSHRQQPHPSVRQQRPQVRHCLGSRAIVGDNQLPVIATLGEY